jgi:hypothetical protein
MFYLLLNLFTKPNFKQERFMFNKSENKGVETFDLNSNFEFYKNEIF